MLKYVLYYFI